MCRTELKLEIFQNYTIVVANLKKKLLQMRKFVSLSSAKLAYQISENPLRTMTQFSAKPINHVEKISLKIDPRRPTPIHRD